LIYTQNKLVCEYLFTQCIDFEHNEDIIFLKENYRRYNKKKGQQKSYPNFSYPILRFYSAGLSGAEGAGRS